MFRYRIYAVCMLATMLALLFANPLHAAEVDKFLPGDTEVVVTVNVRQILDSPLVKKDALGKLKDDIKGNANLKTALESMGLDPLKDIDHLVLAIPGGKGDVKALILVHGRFDKAKIETAAQQAAKDHADKLKIHKDVADAAGTKHAVYEIKVPDASQTLFAALVDKGPLVLATGTDGKANLLEALAKSAPGKKAELKSKELQALLEKTDTKQSITVTALGSAVTKMIDDPQAKPLLEKLELRQRRCRDYRGHQA